MDEEHLAAALRYVSLNPVRARLVERPQDWRWSSTSAHLHGKDDGLTALAPVKNRFSHFADLLGSEPEADLFDQLRVAESIGRPLGDDRFLSRIERRTGRTSSRASVVRSRSDRRPVTGIIAEPGVRIKCTVTVTLEEPRHRCPGVHPALIAAEQVSDTSLIVSFACDAGRRRAFLRNEYSPAR